jgi:hypothetical protein
MVVGQSKFEITELMQTDDEATEPGSNGNNDSFGPYIFPTISERENSSYLAENNRFRKRLRSRKFPLLHKLLFLSYGNNSENFREIKIENPKIMAKSVILRTSVSLRTIFVAFRKKMIKRKVDRCRNYSILSRCSSQITSPSRTQVAFLSSPDDQAEIWQISTIVWDDIDLNFAILVLQKSHEDLFDP